MTYYLAKQFIIHSQRLFELMNGRFSDYRHAMQKQNLIDQFHQTSLLSFSFFLRRILNFA